MSLLSIEPVQIPNAPRARMFSVDQISRNGDRFIKRLVLEENQIFDLREQRIGLFVEGFLGLETMLGRVLQVGQRWSEKRLIACYSSKVSGGFIYDQIASEGLAPIVEKTPSSWSVGKMTFTSIEKLSNLRKKQSGDPIEAVFVLDSNCMVHHARTMHRWNGTVHDRPGLVSNFLVDEEDSGLEPLLVVMTRQKALSIDTEKMARMYNREAWYFCDGPSMSIPKKDSTSSFG